MTVPERRLRLFVALPPPRAARDVLARHVARCVALAPEQRWSPVANLHLTLRFLGWVGEDTRERVEAELQRVRHPAFRVRLGGTGRFGSPGRPRVVWVGVEEGLDGLRSLAAAVGEACGRAGQAGDDRPFQPHLTLCRVRRGAALPALPEPPPIPTWEASSFTLFESRPGRGGSVYLPLHSYPFGGAAPPLSGEGE